MEILKKPVHEPVKAVLFDFDGTISTLRCGWESVMAPLMVEKISACENGNGTDVLSIVNEYINESTGIQTIFQMKWLADQVSFRGGNASDPWDYKDEYNSRLMDQIKWKKNRLETGEDVEETYLMKGANDFLRKLKEKGINIFVASGTDHSDVVEEAKALGVYDYFDELMGAPFHQENCSKEAVMEKLIRKYHLLGNQIAVIGDGKVEISLGKRNGARTIGLASNEVQRFGINPVKRDRLIHAGADAICGDFTETEAIFNFLDIHD